jgi:hypothetical protein
MRAGQAIYMVMFDGVIVRPARSGDVAGIAEVWLSTAAYHADLDSEHFRVPSAEGLAEGWEDQLGRDNKGSLQLVAEVDGRVIRPPTMARRAARGMTRSARDD